MKFESKKINPKILTIIILIVVVVLGYFIFREFISNDDSLLNNQSNTYISSTKIGQYIDILNKENIGFTSNINSQILTEAIDFSVHISPSQGSGRNNPFLP